MSDAPFLPMVEAFSSDRDEALCLAMLRARTVPRVSYAISGMQRSRRVAGVGRVCLVESFQRCLVSPYVEGPSGPQKDRLSINHWPSVNRSSHVGWRSGISDVSDDIHPLSDTGLIRSQTLKNEIHIDQSED